MTSHPSGTPVQGCTHKNQHVHGERNTYARKCCACPACAEASRTYYRETARRLRGHEARADATPVREHVHRLLEAPMTVRAISKASGVAEQTIQEISRGRRPTTTQAVADLLLAVPAVPSQRPGYVDATGSRRRLQHLAVSGWPTQVVADACGLHIRQVVSIRLGEFVEISTRNAAKITAGTRGLLSRTPPAGRKSTHARTVAARNGWVSMFAYDDIDDPTETPNVTPLVAPSKYSTPVEEKLDELEYLIDAGTPVVEALNRVGYASFDSVEKVARRHRPALVARLQRLNRGDAA